MKAILMVFVLLCASCGSRGRVELVRTGPNSVLIFDAFCTVEITRSRAIGRKNRLVIREQDVVCSSLNVTKREYLTSEYGLEEILEDGQRVYIITDTSMDNLYRYLMAHNLMEEE